MFARQKRLLVETVRTFNERGINAIVFKGYPAALNYDLPSIRSFADVDVSVSAANYDTARDLQETLHKRHVPVDLHNEFRQLDTLNWQTVFLRTTTIPVLGEEVRILCPEDHLRIMAVHWLTDGGEYRERLWDIYYAVANRPADFDWNKCLDVVSPTRRKWVITTIGLAHKYLGLEIGDLPFADEAKDIPKWIIKTVEREWARDVRLIPLRIAYRKPRMLFRQIAKRLPPNPITATIDMEGEFDDRPRIWYQLGSIAKRIPPSLLRFVDLAKARLRR